MRSSSPGDDARRRQADLQGGSRQTRAEHLALAPTRAIHDVGRAMKIGVALSSGGSAAMAQIGVLEELDAAGLRIEQVAGTSGGAIVGAAYCAGGLREMRDAMCGLSRAGVFSLFDPRWPRLGMLEGRRAMEFLRPFTGERFEDLAIPFAAIATDLDSGRALRLCEGDVLSAVRASLAVPGFLTPATLDGRQLVDGALSDPVPVDAVRSLGARFVLAVSVLPLAEDLLAHWKRDAAWDPWELTRLATDAWQAWSQGAQSAAAGESEVTDSEPAGLDANERRGLADVISRASYIGQCQIAALRLRDRPPDFLISLRVPDPGLFDFHRTAELVEIGRQAAREQLPALLAAVRRAEPGPQRLKRWLARRRLLRELERRRAELARLASSLIPTDRRDD